MSKDYYQELDVYDTTSNVERDLANRDSRLNRLERDTKNFKSDAQRLLGNLPQEDVHYQNKFDLDSAVANAHKYSTATKDTLRQLEVARQEDEVLKTLIRRNNDIAKMVYNANEGRQRPHLDRRSRIIDINLNAYREKKSLVNRLVYVVYFLIFALAIGASVMVGVITTRTAGISMLLGVVALFVVAYMGGPSSDVDPDNYSFLKTYGDFSMGVAKGATKEFIDLVAPMKTCPPRCKKKLSHSQAVEKERKRRGECDPSRDLDCPSIDQDLMPYDYKINDPAKASKFFAKGKFDQIDDTGKPFTCVWSGDQKLRPSYEPHVIRSSIPCSYYENRQNA